MTENRKHVKYAIITIDEGNHLENPSDAFIKLEPIASNTIANDKNKYFILYDFNFAKIQQILSSFLTKGKIEYYIFPLILLNVACVIPK